MTAPEIIAACETGGLSLTVTERGTIHCRPTPPPALLAELRANRDEVRALLRDPDRAGWEMPSPEAMAAARQDRPRADSQEVSAADESIALGSPRRTEER